MSASPAKPTVEALGAFLAAEFPQNRCTLESLAPYGATVRLRVGAADLRPGGTVSGPSMMAVADVALYAALLGEIGLEPLALTTDLSVHFLRKPAAGRDLLGVCTLLKVGRRLAVGEVRVYSEGEAAPVAHAVGTYAIPR